MKEYTEGTYLIMGTEYETANLPDEMEVNVVALRFCLPRYLTEDLLSYTSIRL